MSDPTIRVPACQKCGTLASPGESYCRSCGTYLLAPTVAAPQQTQPPPTSPPQSTVTAVSPGMQVGTPMQGQRPLNVGRKRRSPLLLGCLIFLVLVGVALAAGGIYVWRSASYTPPDRTAPEIPERGGGTMTEFPVDNDPNAPAHPTAVQTEALGGTIAKANTSSATKLPPGVDRAKLAKGATSMTSSTYRTRPKNSSSPSSGDIYINVLNVAPNQPNFGNGLASSITEATRGQQTGVRVSSPSGAVYAGSKIVAPQASVYVLTKQGGNIVVIIYSDDTANQSTVDRLAQNVGNGQGLIDYAEVKDSLWTLPAASPAGLTLTEINTISGDQIERSIASTSGTNVDDTQRILSQMRMFIPARLTGARYVDSAKGEWMTLNFEYESSFQAWRTWLLAKGALGLGGAESTTVRDVKALYLKQEGMRILVFQKGPYLIFLSGPDGASMDQLVTLGNQFQV